MGQDLDLEAYRRRYSRADRPGWEALDAAVARLYPGRAPDETRAPTVPHRFGGTDPLDQIVAFARPEAPTPHRHLISYGLSQLDYEEAAIGDAHSGWGFELSLRIAGLGPVPRWAADRLQGLARYVERTERWFEPGCHIGFRHGLDPDAPTLLSGFLAAPDPEMPEIATPHGAVQFLQLIGITGGEIAAIQDGRVRAEALLAALRDRDPLGAVDLDRESLF
ncbi:MAG: suppressor of fused domain protein [Pseudomonadota bacterium]